MYMFKTPQGNLLVLMSGGLIWYAIYRGGKYEIKYKELVFQADIPINR